MPFKVTELISLRFKWKDNLFVWGNKYLGQGGGGSEPFDSDSKCGENALLSYFTAVFLYVSGLTTHLQCSPDLKISLQADSPDTIIDLRTFIRLFCNSSLLMRVSWTQSFPSSPGQDFETLMAHRPRRDGSAWVSVLGSGRDGSPVWNSCSSLGLRTFVQSSL